LKLLYDALLELRKTRELLVQAGATRSLRKLRSTQKSLEGAARYMELQLEEDRATTAAAEALVKGGLH
jgi:hypothetical protein